MKLDRKVIDFLKTYFVPRRGDSHVAGSILPGGTNTYNLGASTNRWDTIYARQVVADSLTGGGGAANADTLDGYHASLTPTPNTILPLDASQKYPSTTYPDALLRNGTRSLTGNLDVAGGVTIDGVDISNHAVDNTIHHIGGMGADSHTQYMHISQGRTVSATHTYQPGAPSPPFYLGANAQDQLITGLYANRAVNLDRSVIAGAGLTGGGVLTADRTIDVGGSANISVTTDAINLTTPGTLSATSTSQATTAHTHAITASNNPGASTQLLKTGVAGDLYLSGDFAVDTDTLFVDVSEDAVYINAGTLPSRRGALTVQPKDANQQGFVLEQKAGQSAPLWRVYDSSGNDLILLTNAGDLESGDPGFVSGLTGWQITHTGNAEFWNATIRGELHTSVFVADEMHATGGTNVLLTAGIVADPGSSGNNVMGGTDIQFTLRMQASWDTGASYFSVNDVIRCKFMGDDGGGLDLWDVYLEVDSVGSVQSRDMGNGDPGYFAMQVTRRSGGASGLEIPAGTAGVLWGNISGSGYSGAILLTSDLSLSPYIDIFTIDNSVTYDPWESQGITPRVRLGNLDGVLGLTEQWGIAFGGDLSDTSVGYGVFSDLQAGLFGITQEWWDLDGNIRGALNPSATTLETLFWLGPSSSDPKFEVTGDGLVRMSGAFIGPTGGILVDGGVVWLPFDGNKRLGGISTMSPSDWMVPSTSTGSIYAGWGAYGAGLVVGDTATNLIFNPNFSSNITDGWTNNGVGTRVKATDLSNIRSGEASFRLQAGASSAQLYTTDVQALANGQTVHATCWMKVEDGSTGTPGRLIIYDTSTPATRATGYSSLTNGTWEMVHVSWTNNTGVAKNIRIYLGNYANDSSTLIWFDEVQMTFGTNAYPLPYVDGDKPGATWSGTPRDSTSARTGQDLEYAVTLPNVWTVSFWWTPTALASETTAVSSRILEWYGDSDDRLIFYQPASTSTEMRIYHQVNGNLSTDDYTGSFTRGEPQHIIATYNGSGYQWWVNGVDQGYTAHSQTWGTTPNILAIGSDYAGGSRAQGIVSDLFVLDKAVDADFVSAVYNAVTPAAINNDLFFKVYDPEAGSTTITPKAFIITGSGNALGVSTNPDPMVIGGITVSAGDLVIGDNQVGSGAMAWDASERLLKFFADGASTPNMWWGPEGLNLYADNTSSLISPAAIKWINPNDPTDPYAIIQVWNDAYDNWFRIRNYPQSGVVGWTHLLTFGNGSYAETAMDAFGLSVAGGMTGILAHSDDNNAHVRMYTDDGPRGGLVNLESSSAQGGTAFEIDVDKTRFYDAVKYVREPSGGTDRTGSMYVPLTSMIGGATLWGNYVSNAGGASKTVSSEWSGVPANVSAIAVRIHARDSVAWSVPENPSTGLFFQMGPANAANQYDHLSMHPIGENAWAAAQGIVKVTSNTVYVKWNASGANTMQVYVGVVGYFI